MDSKKEQEIAAINSMWLTHFNHLNLNIKILMAQCHPGESKLKS